MKKNKAMRLASILLVVTLLTTCAISGTFAKYVTTDSATDTARVAKWGIVISGSGSLFGKNYETGATSVPSANTTATALSVMSSDASKLVAPGTKSDKGLSLSISGTPEVRTEVAVEVNAKDIYLAAGDYAVMKEEKVSAADYATAVTAGLYTKSGTAYTKIADAATTPYDATATYYVVSDAANVATGGYYPVQYTYNATNKKATEIAFDIAKAVKGSDPAAADDTDATTAGVTYTGNSFKKVFNPNEAITNAAVLGVANPDIAWSWTFSVDAATDAKDTILGNLAANLADVVSVDTSNGDVTVLTVDATTGVVSDGTNEVGCVLTAFGITITATQVD